MTDSNLRELERRWRQSGSLEDELAYLNETVRRGMDPTPYVSALERHCIKTGALDDELAYLREAVKVGRSPLELYRAMLGKMPDWTQCERNEQPRTARTNGNKLQMIFATIPRIADAAIAEVYTGDVAEIPESEREITALCSHYVRELCRAGGEEFGHTLRRSEGPPPVLTARIRGRVIGYQTSQGQLVNVLDVMGRPTHTINTGVHIDYLALFGSKYQVHAEQQHPPRTFPRSYTFYTHKTDEQRIIIGRAEHAVLRIEPAEDR